MLELARKLLGYLLARSREQPFVGVMYFIIAGPALFLIVQNLRLIWAGATAPPFTRPGPVWPLSNPIPPVGSALLIFAIASVVVFDRWAAGHATTKHPQAGNEVAPPNINEWVLGRVYSRTWSPDPGEFQLEPTSDLCKLTAEHLRTHLIVVAPTGSGKTRSVLEPALYLFKRTGAAALYFDAKGDDFHPRHFHLNFDLDDPHTSMRLNVWSGRTPREMGERLGEALVPDMGMNKAYFANNAKDTMASLVAAHHQAYDEMPGLKRLLAYLRDPQAREDLAQELLNAGLSEDCEELLDLQRINQLSAQKNDALGSLDTALAPLARGEIADLLTTSSSGYSIEQLIRQPVRVRFVLPVGRHPRVAPIVGRLVLAQFTYAVISPDCNKAILKAAVIDEAHNFVTPTIAKGMAMARENRGCYMLAFQNLSQITEPALREDILSVAGNKLVMAGVGNFDADKFSKLFGSQERPYTVHNQSTNLGRNSSQSRGSGHGTGDLLSPSVSGLRQQSSRASSSSLQQSNGSSVQVRERPDFLPSEIRALPQFHVLIEMRDSRGEVTPPTVVQLDSELIQDASNAQALRLYNETGRLEAAPRLPVLPAVGGSPIANRSRHQITEIIAPKESHPSTLEADAHVPNDCASTYQAMEPNLPVPPSTQVPGWVQDAASVIASRLGVTIPEATELAVTVCKNGRDSAYILDNLGHVSEAPNVKNPADLFRFLVTRNQHRRPPTTAAAPASSGKPTERDVAH